MPQMSPLLWAWLFLMFSLMLLVSFIKLYFLIHNKTIKQNDETNYVSTNSTEKININWMW